MSINPEDVKLYESERLTDEDDGGGRATGIAVVDNEINNLYQDISRVDRTLGDVSLRKGFVGIATNNSDVYLGAHAIIVEPPADPNVHVVIFDAGSEDDERAAAQQRIESYVVRGAAAQWHLMGNQYEGQRQLVAFQRVEQPIPEVGEVFLLENTANGDEQYIRITEVEHAVQPFTVEVGNSLSTFERRRLDLGISAPLDFTFPGGEVRASGPTSPHADVNTTEVADAARYYGVSNSVEEANVGDFGIKVASIFSNLVPSAQAENPLTDQPMSTQPRDVREAAASDYVQALTLGYVTSTQVQGYLIRPAVRGTVSLTIGGSTYADDGSGILTRASGAHPFATLEIEHDTGIIMGTRDSGSGGGSDTGSVTFRPGGVFTGKPVSLSEEVTIANRGYNWIRTFPDGKPRPGTTVVSYMAQGKWYDLRDNGSGQLEGIGAGTVNYVTGTISVTLEALPDIGSSIFFSFIIDLADDSDERSGVVATAGGEITVAFEAGAQPGTVVITFDSGEVERTLTDAADTAILAGYGEGHIDYANGTATFKPTTLPDDGTDITIDYDYAAALQYVIASPSFTGGVISGTIPNAPLEPGSVVLEGLVSYKNSYGLDITRLHSMVDDGDGGVLYGLNSSSRGQQGVGTIDYANGNFSIELLHEWPVYRRAYSTASGYSYTLGVAREEISGPVTIRYQSASPSASSGQTIVGVDTVELDLIPSASFKSLIPGSLMFEWAGQTYIDRDGQIYTGFDSETGAATSVGSVNYNDRKITLNAWPDAAPLSVDVVAAMTVNERLAVDEISFRTPGRPIRPQSMSVTVTDEDGNVISEVAGVDGTITGPSVDGFVNVDTGVVQLVFTDGVDPIYVYPDSGIYSAVLFSFLPLDAELIGLNPVRLPSDGRVPIFRQGGLVVVSHTASLNINTPSAGQVVNLARDHQAEIIVEDSNGVKMDPAQYSVNLQGGSVTFEDPLVLQAADTTLLTVPLFVKDRIEHMTVLNDVEITGELTFIGPLAFDFPADETVVSSALVWGDINSRVFNYFTQRTWNSGSPNWTDSRIGDDTTANYDIVNNPIEYANNGAITEKWAIVFTGITVFYLVGETLGVVATGSTAADFAPLNPNTGNPYFVMRAAGWGGGWVNGNVVRFDMEGCLAPIWLARTVLSGQATEDDDKFVLQIRGDSD